MINLLESRALTVIVINDITTRYYTGQKNYYARILSRYYDQLRHKNYKYRLHGYLMWTG